MIREIYSLQWDCPEGILWFGRRRILVAIFLALLIGLHSAGIASGAEQGEAGWELHQGSNIVGSSVVLLTARGIKIGIQKSGLRLFAVAPDYKIFLYNDPNKMVYECPFQRFSSFMNRNEAVFAGNLFESLPFMKDGRVQILHLDAVKYKTPTWLAKRALQEHKQGLTDRGAVALASYCLADKLPVPKQEAQILQKFYGLPALPGVPLEFKYINLGSEHWRRLYTENWTPKIIPASEFVRPKGYRPVKTIEEVSADGTQSKGFTDMIDSLGKLRQ